MAWHQLGAKPLSIAMMTLFLKHMHCQACGVKKLIKRFNLAGCSHQDVSDGCWLPTWFPAASGHQGKIAADTEKCKVCIIHTRLSLKHICLLLLTDKWKAEKRRLDLTAKRAINREMKLPPTLMTGNDNGALKNTKFGLNYFFFFLIQLFLQQMDFPTPLTSLVLGYISNQWFCINWFHRLVEWLVYFYFILFHFQFRYVLFDPKGIQCNKWPQATSNISILN